MEHPELTLCPPPEESFFLAGVPPAAAVAGGVMASLGGSLGAEWERTLLATSLVATWIRAPAAV